ncbi:hypothetical protein [Actinomadura harenae]|nr:hypothetical protein [Actinomadura harenae]
MASRKPTQVVPSSALEDAVREQLIGWGLVDSAEGASALDLARRLDAGDVRASAAAMLHGQLRALLSDLRKLAPPADSDDAVDELAAQREQRRRAAGMP